MSIEPENNVTSPHKLSRRHFIQHGAVLVGGMTLLPLFSHEVMGKPAPADEALFWYQRPLRIMHTVLRETDAKNYDASAVVAYMQKTGANTLCVNAGGIVDFFKILYQLPMSTLLWAKGTC